MSLSWWRARLCTTFPAVISLLRPLLDVSGSAEQPISSLTESLSLFSSLGPRGLLRIRIVGSLFCEPSRKLVRISCGIKLRSRPMGQCCFIIGGLSSPCSGCCCSYKSVQLLSFVASILSENWSGWHVGTRESESNHV